VLENPSDLDMQTGRSERQSGRGGKEGEKKKKKKKTRARTRRERERESGTDLYNLL
jgi:hypothetical protein